MKIIIILKNVMKLGIYSENLGIALGACFTDLFQRFRLTVLRGGDEHF